MRWVFLQAVGKPGGGVWNVGDVASEQEIGHALESLQRRGLIAPEGSPLPAQIDAGSPAEQISQIVSELQAAQNRAAQAEEVLKQYSDRNNQLAEQNEALKVELQAAQNADLTAIQAERDKLFATIEAIIPTSDRALGALTVDQLTAIAQHRGLDPIPTSKGEIVAALKPASPAQ